MGLPGGEFELLAAFCEHANEVLTREQLLDFTRGKSSAGMDRSINIQVSRLRRKIRKGPEGPCAHPDSPLGWIYLFRRGHFQ